jgi:hypothetical protein
MPQTMTLNISAKIDKGPNLTSEAKFDVTTYAAIVEENVSKCSCCTFELPAFTVDEYTQVLITSDKYSVDKDATGTQVGPCQTAPAKYITYELSKVPALEPAAGCKAAAPAEGIVCPSLPNRLKRPLILGPCDLSSNPQGFNTIKFNNDLTVNVKVSVLVFRLSKPTP